MSGGIARGLRAALLAVMSCFAICAPNAASAMSHAGIFASAASMQDADERVYVINGDGNVDVYAAGAHGDAAPLYVITGVGPVADISGDSQGNLYAAVGPQIFANGTSASTAILFFPHGSRRYAAYIAGPATGLHSVGRITVDKVTGKIFALDFNDTTSPTPSIDLLRFPPHVFGNVSPFANAFLDFAGYQLTSDSTGHNLLYANSGEFGDYWPGIITLPKQFSNFPYPDSGPAAIYNLNFFGVRGIADDPEKHQYLVTHCCDAYSGITRLAENTNGVGAESPGGPAAQKFKPLPISTITSAQDCMGQLSLDRERNIYAICGNTIRVYAHDAFGNATPIRVIGGRKTGLSQPAAIYVGL